MTIAQWLSQATAELTQSGIATARLDALVLLEDCFGSTPGPTPSRSRAHLLAHPEIELTAEQQQVLTEHINRRAGHEPLAYIRGKAEFYGREFVVSPDVLVPRPETETMIDLLKSLPTADAAVLVDVGTGSGAIAITARLELAHARVFATDIDEGCLEVARRNARTHGVPDITFENHDLLQGLIFPEPLLAHQEPFIVAANLPYVPEEYHINQAAALEPKMAIFGGPDGLQVYRKLFKQISRLGKQPTYILTEALPPSHEGVLDMAELYGYRQIALEDFIQVFEQKQKP